MSTEIKCEWLDCRWNQGGICQMAWLTLSKFGVIAAYRLGGVVCDAYQKGD